MTNTAKAVVDGLYLFNQSDAHLVYTLAEFNSFFIYPLLAGKCRIFYDGDKPIGLVTWAWLTDEEAEAFLNMDWQPEEATYSRDRSDQLWGIEFIAPYGDARKVMREMRKISKHLYGDTKCNWRRLHDPYTKHTRSF